MKNIIVIGAVALFILGGYFVYQSNVTDIGDEIAATQNELAVTKETNDTEMEKKSLDHLPTITPISHASMVMTWGDATIYVDPVGDVSAYTDMMAPSLVLLTDIHGDHLNAETLEGIIAADSRIIAPQAVYDLLPENIAAQTEVMNNGEVEELLGFSVTAIPMYNFPELPDSRHTKGRGNGYLIQQGEVRVYVAGDTGPIPEMLELTDIDLAFVPMNMPFTMTVDEAANAVVAFAPEVVVPYHYRGQDGLSDVSRFRELVETANSDINVLLLNWYPEAPAAEETLETEE